MGVEIWSVNYPIEVVEIFGSPSISKIDILGDLHAKFHDFCSKCTIVSQYYYTKRIASDSYSMWPYLFSTGNNDLLL